MEARGEAPLERAISELLCEEDRREESPGEREDVRWSTR